MSQQGVDLQVIWAISHNTCDLSVIRNVQLKSESAGQVAVKHVLKYGQVYYAVIC
jgi:hypothetical protein